METQGEAVEDAGLEVTEVNISVNDIHLPSEDAGQVQEHARVQ